MAERLDDARWARASAFLPPRLRPLVTNAMLRPHWLPGQDAFLYRREEPGGAARFLLVDAAAGGATRPAFDHARLAAALSDAMGTDVAADRLPLSEIVPERAGLRFHALGRDWRWDDAQGLRESPLPPVAPHEVASPDGRLVVFRRGHDLWLRVRATGEERALTTDGEEGFAYGKSPDANLVTVTLRRQGLTLPPAVLWSPCSTRLLTHRLDERRVRALPLVQHVPEDGSCAPILHRFRFALSGDAEVPLAHHLILGVETGADTPLDTAPQIVPMMSPLEAEEAWWSADSARVFLLDRERGSRRLALLEADARSGAVREVLHETAETWLDTNLAVTGLANIRVLDRSGEVIWFSQRSGYAHLYRHDLATGALLNPITRGPFVVRDIVHLDEAARRIFVTVGGLDPSADPHLRQLCRVNLDGSGFTLLTPEPEDHAVAYPALRVTRDHTVRRREPGRGVAPSGRFFVHTRSTIGSLPVSALRDAEGREIAVLERGALAPAVRWPHPPLPFRLMAADGTTPLFGAMWFPSDFDPSRRYPILDMIYPGPQRTQVPKAMLSDGEAELGRVSLPQALAEIGCIVIELDGRGTPLREKAFHDLSFGRLDDPGTLADHVAGLRQLAERHPFLDPGRVGITGHSGGGYATVRAMLTYPEVFRAGVASAGNHDQRGYSFSWCEKYQGPVTPLPDGGTSFDAAANPPLASRLQGQLLLATGEMDDNVHPALTLQMAAALIAADRDFELMVLPNQNHATIVTDPYFLRRAMGFLARHLVDA
ncbi:prolyl oligopeptidase family serine peptidase [Muricoccus radiodurans]|uniref:S9 family peptidase n=1 Tax=Muricoccus radiodurans TaxID=2231721 RepID=UPI003CF1AC3A